MGGKGLFVAAGFSTESVKDKSSYKLIVPVPPSGDLFVNWLGSNISKLLPVRDDEPKRPAFVGGWNHGSEGCNEVIRAWQMENSMANMEISMENSKFLVDGIRSEHGPMLLRGPFKALCQKFERPTKYICLRQGSGEWPRGWLQKDGPAARNVADGNGWSLDLQTTQIWSKSTFCFSKIDAKL